MYGQGKGMVLPRRKYSVKPKATYKRRAPAVAKPKAAYKKRAPTYVGRKKSVTFRLARVERAVRHNWEKFMSYIYTNYTSLSPITILPLITPPTIGANRTFTTASDTIYNIKAYLQTIKIDVATRPVWGTGVTLTNTPYTEPVFYRCFLVSPKHGLRISQGANEPTSLVSSNFIRGVHFESATAFVNFAPFLNLEYFRVHAYRDYKYLPTVSAAGTVTQPADPADGMKSFSFLIKPNLLLDSKNQAWSQMEADDVPFSKQLYLVFIAHTTATSQTAIPMNLHISARYTMAQLQNR